MISVFHSFYNNSKVFPHPHHLLQEGTSSVLFRAWSSATSSRIPCKLAMPPPCLPGCPGTHLGTRAGKPLTAAPWLQAAASMQFSPAVSSPRRNWHIFNEEKVLTVKDSDILPHRVAQEDPVGCPGSLCLQSGEHLKLLQ